MQGNKYTNKAIILNFASISFEDVRIAILVGGESDTLACITGAIAEAYYGVPKIICCRNVSST